MQVSGNSRIIFRPAKLIGWLMKSSELASKSSSKTIAAVRCLSTSSVSNWSTINIHHSARQKINILNNRISNSLHSHTEPERPYVDPKFSYVYGRSRNHLIHSTVAHELYKQIKAMPDEVAFISYSENKQATFKQLDQDINKLVKSLMKQFGINKGDYIGVFAYNCYNWLVIQLACSRIGAILTPINPSYKPQELAFILETGQVKCLFMPGPKSVQSELNNHIKVLLSDKIVSLSKESKLQLEHVILMDTDIEYIITNNSSPIVDDTKSENFIDFKLANCKLYNWSATESDGIIFKSEEEAKGAGVDIGEAFILDPDLVSPDDLFAVYYTSGTTGKPKGACLSQFTVVNNVRFCQFRLRHGKPSDWKSICATTLPMFHIFAGVLNTLSPVLNNSRVIYSSYKYDIATLVNSIIEGGANLTTLTPTILIDMLSYIETNNITNVPLRIIQSGGAALSPEVVSRTFKTLPDIEEVRCGYGSTENGAVATFQTIYEPNEMRPFTVGMPIDFSEIRIVKPNTTQVVPHGEKGEVQTRGYNTMVEYLDQPEKTAEVITQNRWYRTGDMGLMLPYGSIQICGRLKNMIIKGGENIYPEEVEQLIHTLEYVEDVHVVGVPDKRFGEQVCAWVKLKPGFSEAKEPQSKESKQIHKSDIIKFCNDNITYFKVPKYLLFVNDFPMTPTKKVQNHIMVEQSIELLGLKDQLS